MSVNHWAQDRRHNCQASKRESKRSNWVSRCRECTGALERDQKCDCHTLDFEDRYRDTWEKAAYFTYTKRESIVFYIQTSIRPRSDGEKGRRIGEKPKTSWTKAEWDAMEKENEDKSAAQEDDEGVMGATTKASSSQSKLPRAWLIKVKKLV